MTQKQMRKRIEAFYREQRQKRIAESGDDEMPAEVEIRMCRMGDGLVIPEGE